MKKLVLFFVSILSVVALFIWADFSVVFSSLRGIDAMSLVLLCLLQLLTVYLITLQWAMLARLTGKHVTLMDTFRVNMAGTFVESVTPSVKAGGEAAKVYVLKRRLGFSLGSGAALVGLQKIVSIIPFMVLSMLGLLWVVVAQGLSSSSFGIMLGALGFLALFMGAVSFMLFFPHKVTMLLSWLPWWRKTSPKVEEGIKNFRQTVDVVKAQHRGVVRPLLLSFLIWGLFPVKTLVAARSLGMDVGFLFLAAATFLSYMVAMVPLLPGGLGSFEAAMTFLLLPVGVAQAKGLALALVVRFVTFWFPFLLSAGVVLLESIPGKLKGTADA